MTDIKNLEPKNVFDFFAKICKIPHGSGNTKAISDFCVNFARKHGYKFVQDSANNVVIFADGTSGYENSEPVILQGHIDMVCDKTADCNKDMQTDSLDLQTDGEFVWAQNTTLGGDDGIAVAYMLALLNDKTIAHPPIEAVFTADEEIGMIGTRKLDTSILKGKMLINIDSEQEGVLTVSCAGGVRANCELPVKFEVNNDIQYCVKIRGLKGGHSGVEINQNRTNANKLMIRMLQFVYLYRDISFKIADINGGTKENAIPNQSTATLCIPENQCESFVESVSFFREIINDEFSVFEPGLKISVEKTGKAKKSMTESSTRNVIFTLSQMPDGVQAMSPDIKDMVQTSLNMGILRTEKDKIFMKYLVRSNAAAGKQTLVRKLQAVIEYSGGTIEFCSDYPAWEYRADSKLREIMIDAYAKFYKSQPVVTSIHAGLECGILAGKIEDMDAVSFGPNLYNVHTAQEKMDVKSVERCWQYLKAVLKKCK